MKALVFPLLGLALAVVTIPAEALAQALPPSWQTRPGALAVDSQRFRADQNRLEMERLRLGADQRRLEAELGRLEAQASRHRIVGARQPEPVQPQPLPALRSPEQERAARQAAEQRRRSDAETVGQIDAWLDRPVP